MIDELNRNRPAKKERKGLFDVDPSWKDEWWGMPKFEMDNCSPSFSITMNFMTAEDVKDFAKRLGLNVTTKSDSAWWPPQQRLKSSEFEYIGPKTDSRYPICIPSKGRADCQMTGKLLDKMGVSYKFFVEETEGDWYIEHLGEDKVIVMPFHDLGEGSIPARNFIWDWAEKNNHKRHWVVDDNINMFTRCSNNRRLQVRGGGYFNAMEDFVDRYENIAIAGPHDQGFMPDRVKSPPFLLNSRVYSCSLIDTSLPYRWRGRYNEDTDLCLRMLKDGYCTVLFRALLMNKMTTHSGANGRTSAMKGGNTDNVYNTNDYRLNFAKSLKRQHPDVVKIVWKFNRWHHSVDYSIFKRNKLVLKEGIVKTCNNNEYNMELVKLK